jgi:hypothetical protein
MKTAECPDLSIDQTSKDQTKKAIHAERAQGVPGGQPQDFQRDLGYPTNRAIVNEEIQGKGVTEGSSQLSVPSSKENPRPA